MPTSIYVPQLYLPVSNNSFIGKEKFIRKENERTSTGRRASGDTG